MNTTKWIMNLGLVSCFTCIAGSIVTWPAPVEVKWLFAGFLCFSATLVFIATRVDI